jgi:hypothetical protein
MAWIEQDAVLMARVCRDDVEAQEFLQLFNRWGHAIDDLVDGDEPKVVRASETIVRAFAMSVVLFGTPFYLRNFLALRQVTLLIANAYADAAAWEKSDIPWRRAWAEHYRHVGIEMAIAVALIVGGFDHARSVSAELRERCQQC